MKATEPIDGRDHSLDGDGFSGNRPFAALVLSDHGMRDGDLSKFVERAVQKEILKQTAADVKRQNADFRLAGDDLQALINATVAAVRRKRKLR